ncbi:MAG: DUF3426 domain-containing protein [Gammaproteobacteria bacterium]|jgi:predicted Zn finger-like uncharacterized protein
MHAQCPNCHSIFRITPEQLRTANGQVRCGVCRTVFDGRAAHVDVGEEEPSPSLRASRRNPTAGTPPKGAPDTAGEGSYPTLNLFPENVPPALREDMETPQPAARSGTLGTVFGALASLLLIVLLGVQYAYFHRDKLAQYPELRPTLNAMCEVTGCSLPPLRNIQDIELLSRNIYSHPNIPHALIITATFVNNAHFAQPYPLLQVSLFDLQGKLLAMRRFKPSEYLQPGTNPNEPMQPGSPVNIRLEVSDPGTNALAFEFKFL